MQLVYLGKLEYLLLRSPLFDRDFFCQLLGSKQYNCCIVSRDVYSFLKHF